MAASCEERASSCLRALSEMVREEDGKPEADDGPLNGEENSGRDGCGADGGALERVDDAPLSR